MEVEIQLQGPLKKYGKEPGAFKWESATETYLVEKLINDLGIPPTAVSFVAVNGVKVDMKCELKGGERIVVYPRVAGG